MFDPVIKATLMSNLKQSRDVVDCPVFCHRRTKLDTFSFRSRDDRKLLFELDLH